MTSDFCGAWAIADSHRRAVEDALRAGLFSGGRVPSVSAVDIGGGVRVIEIVGLMTKGGSALLGTPGTAAIRAAVTSAAADKGVKLIVLRVDSAGGTVAGVDELAQAVRVATTKKPVIAYVEDMCASAAYWVASQATQVQMNRAGRCGSVGCYLIVEDASGRAEQEGIKVHVIRSSEFKGAGAFGTEITAAQLSEWQRHVDHVHRLFADSVVRARPGVDRRSFDGRLFAAQDARRYGLIDGITTWEDVLSGKATSASASMSATERAHRWIDAKIALGGVSKVEATAALAEAEPALYENWLEEANR